MPCLLVNRHQHAGRSYHLHIQCLVRQEEGQWHFTKQTSGGKPWTSWHRVFQTKACCKCMYNKSLCVKICVILPTATCSVWITKVKPSYNRPVQGLRVPVVWGSQISRISIHAFGKFTSPQHRPPLPLKNYSWYSFLLEAESTPGP
jgi:hypothetical protein